MPAIDIWYDHSKNVWRGVHVMNFLLKLKIAFPLLLHHILIYLWWILFLHRWITFNLRLLLSCITEYIGMRVQTFLGITHRCIERLTTLFMWVQLLFVFFFRVISKHIHISVISNVQLAGLFFRACELLPLEWLVSSDAVWYKQRKEYEISPQNFALSSTVKRSVNLWTEWWKT
jgi:hypothetical protein